MTKSNKLRLLLFSLLLVFSSFLFVACGEVNYSSTTLTSSESIIELFVGEQKNVTFTINNPVGNMSSNLICTPESLSNPNVCTVEQLATQNYSTTYTITGVQGGTTTLEITTQEGGKTQSIDIIVREYSSEITAGNNSLYVSLSTKFIPSATDFNYSSNEVTERDLDFYFYGVKNSGELVLDDVRQDGQFINEFVSVELVNVLNNSYLIFTDSNGELWTLGNQTIVTGSNNIKYQFLEVGLTEDNQYDFNLDNATTVSPGAKFTFITNYISDTEEEIFCEREFYVIDDINSESVSHDYGYKISERDFVAGTDSSYKLEQLRHGNIILIPRYTATIENGAYIGETVEYLTAFLEVTIDSPNDLLQMEFYTDNETILNYTKVGQIQYDTYTTYYFQINCGSSVSSSTNFNVRFYYKGFENSTDSNVNYVYSVPIQIRIIPLTLFINNIDYSIFESTFTFYDNYIGDAGWQEFNFTASPTGSEYDNLVIDLTDTDLQLRYRNQTYTNQEVVITDLSYPVYIKGMTNAQLTNEIRRIPITLNFNITQEDSLETYINYEIIKGVTTSDFDTDEFEQNIYLDYNNKEPQQFLDIYVDAQFASMTFTVNNDRGGSDVVDFSYDRNAPFQQVGYNYYLDFSITPKRLGTGYYTITLDNGKTIELTVTVAEALNSVSVESSDEQRLIRNDPEGTEGSILYYVLNNGNDGYFDISVIGNNDENSTAINNVETRLNSQFIQLGQPSNNNKNFNVYVRQNGTSQITLVVNGYSIENFQRLPKAITYYIDVITFNYINLLNIYKTSDGENDAYPQNTRASYGYVYSNTNLTDKRSLTLSASIANENAYLFSNPATGAYIDDTYRLEYLYWEVSNSSSANNIRIYTDDGVLVDYMYYSANSSNFYTINNYGTFDTSTMTFIADSNCRSGFSLIAHVRQYGMTYSFTVNVVVRQYEEVERITLQTSITDNVLEFSALEREKSIIAYATNSTATNPKIVALFEEGEIEIDGDPNGPYVMFDEFTDSDYIESEGKYQINLKVNDDFVIHAENYTGKMQGTLYITAEDWLDNSGGIIPDYLDRVITITINFANGTENNRFTIDDADDLLAIKDNLSAHYQIRTTIDVSNISSQLPLGELKGSIIGLNEYATITGINIILPTTEVVDTTTTNYYYGLFSKIDTNAYINYVSFEGRFNVGSADSRVSNAYVGLIAGLNNGNLINVGVTITNSNIYVQNGSIGGVVGRNNGLILQDYTLFEANDSETRSQEYDQTTTISNDDTTETISLYAGLTPKITVYMNDFMNVYYVVSDIETHIGGLVGYNSGTIKKIDSTKLVFSGYLNYMAYSMINAVASSSTSNNSAVLNSFAGALVGKTEADALIFAGSNSYNSDDGIVFTSYNTYEQTGFTAGTPGAYNAGKGIVVGGEVWGYGYVGGVVGYISETNSTDAFAGITSRVFVRGQNFNSQPAMIAGLININSQSSQATLTSALAMQAVDDGRVGEEASMIVLYNGSVVEEYLNNTNIMAFGTGNHNLSIMSNYEGDSSSNKAYRNVLSYNISRNKELLGDLDSITIQSSDKSIYYGDVVVVSFDTQIGGNLLIGQAFFEYGSEGDLSLSDNFNNKLVSDESSAFNIYYMYYFQAASTSGDVDITDAQNNLDTYLNKVNMIDSLYPFTVNGEMTFTSKNSDILTIDQNGIITVKRTGLALIEASSILNTNNALSFYIYVINYINSESSLSEEEKSSIVYPISTTESIPLDTSTIYIRGNSSETIYVLPKYDLDLTISNLNANNNRFVSDRNGQVSFYGIVFELAGNESVSASVVEVKDEGESNNIDINVVGSTITLRKTSDAVEGIYDLVITPRIVLVMDEGNRQVTYYSNINKQLTNTKADYKYGAISIENVKFNDALIFTSKTIVDEIIVTSTDGSEENEMPKYYIVDFNNNNIQGTVEDLPYLYTEDEQLFNVKFTYVSSTSNDLNIYTHRYKIEVEVNRYSPMYLNRYEENIYGNYTLYLQSGTNSGVVDVIVINFERTNVNSIVVDNYTRVTDATANNGLSSASELAYPGESGLLAITITPEDSDFDYILIENDERNYQDGNASANFSFLARNINLEGDANLFDRENITSSSTSRGIIIALDDIIEVYSKVWTREEVEAAGLNEGLIGKNKYQEYNGIIYIQYDMGSINVNDGSSSYINISLIKDNEQLFQVTKELTVKLQYFATVELDGKDATYNQGDYYASYEVARGLRYKLNINSYGFMADNIQLTLSNESLGTIVQENGEYYLQITSNAIVYQNSGNIFDIIVSATQVEGEITRTASSKTQINIYEYVVNYDGEVNQNEDIVTNMGDGVINVQVGTQITFAIDMYEFIEYDSSNNEVVARIEQFLDELTSKGKWTAYTNLITTELPDNTAAKDYNNFPSDRLKLDLGYNNNIAYENSNYYFNSTGLNLIPTKTHTPNDRFYYFRYEGVFNVENGIYYYDENASGTSARSRTIETTFVLDVYSSSSDDSPIPIYDYSDFLNMQSGGYYILLNDITLPSTASDDGSVQAFTPLNGTFASLDGNGHTINLSGTYDMGTLSNIAVFSSLNEGSVIKNLNVNYTSSSDGSDLNTDASDTTYGLYGLRTVKFETSATSFVFGGLVATNSGIITNCHVYTDDSVSDYYIAVKADNALNSASQIGGLVGTNSGYITNSTVSINVKTPFNVAGFVAQNSGKISGCVFKEGIIINNTQLDKNAAGFVLNNGENGVILTSYVSGLQSNDRPYSNDTNSRITSTQPAGGFAYQNIGEISDCYSNINLNQTTSRMAGFVYANGGNIENSFSLSVLRNDNSASAGFVMVNEAEGTQGTFANCYYFYNNGSEEGSVAEYGQINTALVQASFEGVSRLNASGFANVAENFQDYSYQSTIGVNAVWFYSNGNSSNSFVEYIPTTDRVIIENDEEEGSANSGKTQSNTVYETQTMVFGSGRLELVNPNISVLSIRNFSYSEVDAVTGEIIYYYVDDPSTPNRGSIHNPRLIDNAETMETEIKEQTANNNVNTTNYRIISDIDYTDYEGLSQLYTVIFAGIIEGNGMEISQISMATMENLESAGLFSQIGQSASKTGTIKNLTIIPREVAFTNTNNVGVLAGTLSYGYIYDVTIRTTEGSNMTVSGLNFVGGIVGKAINSYIIKDVYSNVSVAANYSASDSIYNESYSNDAGFSYAGGIAGFLGRGSLYNAHVEGITTVMGGRAGFAYGGIGTGANINYTYVDIVSGSRIRAYYYGGFVTGEVSGTLTHSYVSDNGNTESVFAVVPRVATAVGGITGLLAGGRIDNAVMYQDFRVTTVGGDNNLIDYVGGLVGLVNTSNVLSSYITNSIVDAEITATAELGGAVGRISSATIIDQVAIKSLTLNVTGQIANPVLGGIVGNIYTASNSSLTMSNSYCWADLNIETSTSGVASIANVGGLIGLGSRTPRMFFCYTTSSINANVYDSRALGESQDFINYLKPVQTEGEWTAPSGATAINFTIHSYNDNDNNYEYVYYFGKEESGNITGGSDNYQIFNSLMPFITFKSKARASSVGLVVNNYGTGSYEYADSLSESSLLTSKNALYNVFGANYYGLVSESGNQGVNQRITYSYANNVYYVQAEGFAENPFVQNANDNTLYEYIDGDTTYTIDTDNLSMYRILVDDKGEYYYYEGGATLNGSTSYRLKNLNTGEYYTISLNEGEDYDDAVNRLYSEIWQVNRSGFATLLLEQNLSWLERK